MNTLSYYRRKQREIVKGAAWVLNTVDDIPLFVSFVYNALNPVELLSTIVTVTDMF